MSRLTEKVKSTEDYIKLPTKDKQEFINKLGRLEDIEDEIGCPLDILRYKEVNYIRDNEQSYGSVLGINLQRKTIMIGTVWSFTEKPLNQFGRTWWLKEDQSE